MDHGGSSPSARAETGPLQTDPVEQGVRLAIHSSCPSSMSIVG